jgi:hypothetical protein
MLSVAALALAIPLHFEPNLGQATPDVRYVAAAPHYTLALSDTAVAINLPSGEPLRMELPRSVPEAIDALRAKPITTLVPNLPRGARKSPFTRGFVTGLSFRGLIWWCKDSSRRSNTTGWWRPAPIRFSFSGASHIRLDPNGDLALETAVGEIRHRQPRLY